MRKEKYASPCPRKRGMNASDANRGFDARAHPGSNFKAATSGTLGTVCGVGEGSWPSDDQTANIRVRHELPIPAFHLRAVGRFGAVWMANKAKTGGLERLKGAENHLVAESAANLQTANSAQRWLRSNRRVFMADTQNKRRARFSEARLSECGL
jgi:hypothetical protein